MIKHVEQLSIIQYYPLENHITNVLEQLTLSIIKQSPYN